MPWSCYLIILVLASTYCHPAENYPQSVYKDPHGSSMFQRSPIGSDVLDRTLPSPCGSNEKFIERMGLRVAYLDHK